MARRANGKNCNFAHGEKDLQNYKTSLCRYNQEGRCSDGADCAFAHGKADLRIQCKFHFEFKNGSCLQGRSCPFSHEKGAAVKRKVDEDPTRVSAVTAKEKESEDRGKWKIDYVTITRKVIVNMENDAVSLMVYGTCKNTRRRCASMIKIYASRVCNVSMHMVRTKLEKIAGVPALSRT